MTVAPPPTPTQRPVAEAPAIAAPPSRVEEEAFRAGGDIWPRTGRVLPWFVAGFLAMIYVVPFDDVRLPVPMPIESTLDRFVLPALALAWAATLLAGSKDGPRLRPNVLNPVLAVFVIVVGLSLLVNYGDIVERGELSFGVKRIAVLLGYLLFFYIAVSVVRPAELRAFGRLLVGLGCVLAAGLVYQYLAGTNPFHDVASRVFTLTSTAPDSVTVPGDLDSAGRVHITGPTHHGLVAATLLAVSLCFAALETARSRTLGRRLVYMLAFALIVAGGLATYRKSSLVLPVVGLIAFVLANPRAIRSVVPTLAVSLALAALVVPSALDTLVALVDPGRLSSQGSTQARLADYDVIRPDVLEKSALGRGFATYEPLRYRLLDNEYLRLLIETGVLGLVAFAAVLLTILALAVAARVKAGANRGPPTPALIGAILVIAVAYAFYDALGFPHVGYLLFFIAAMAVLAAEVPRPVLAPRTLQPAGGPASVLQEGAKAAPTQPTRRPRPLGAAVAAAVVAVAALAGLIAGGLRPEPPADLKLIQSESVSLTVPADWRNLDPAPDLPGAELTGRIDLAPGDPATDGALVAGVVDTSEPSLLPRGFQASLPGAPARDDPVLLGELRGYRYAGLEPKGFPGELTAYVSPTTHGVVTIFCLAGSESRTFLSVCERVASTLEPLRGRPVSLEPSERFVTTLGRAFDRLNAARREGRRRLRGVRTAEAQASAADRLAAAYGSSRRAISGLLASPEGTPAQAALVSALSEAERAHLSMSRAAGAGNPAAYARARARAASAERRLQGAVGALRQAGEALR